MTSLVPVRPGPTNSLTDVAGLRVGHHQRVGDGWLSGTTVIRCDDVPGPDGGGAVAGVDVRGGGPGTRETDLLDPRAMVERVHAICLSGGSAFGLAPADGVMRALRDAGIGRPVGFGNGDDDAPGEADTAAAAPGQGAASPSGDTGPASAPPRTDDSHAPDTDPSSAGADVPTHDTQAASAGADVPTPHTEAASAGTEMPAPHTQAASAGADMPTPHTEAASAGGDVPAPDIRVPIVPGAVIFDLGRGGQVGATPDADFGAAAWAAATEGPVALGVVGAGTGAQVFGGIKGGVGSASAVLPDGTTVAALAVVNAAGSPVDPRDGTLLGARVLLPGDLDGLGLAVTDPTNGPDSLAGPDGPPRNSRDTGLAAPSVEDVQAARERALALLPPGARAAAPDTLATTLVVLATDAALSTAQCSKVAGLGQDGLVRALQPIHSMVDGDSVFALSTGARPAPDPLGLHILLDAAADVVTRAVVRGVLAASSVTTPGGAWLSYRDAYPSAFPTTPGAGSRMG